MFKGKFSFFFIFFFSVLFGQKNFDGLKTKIHKNRETANNREVIELINQQTGSFSEAQQAELDIIKIEALNELGLSDEAFSISQNILDKKHLTASLQLRNHLQRSFIYELGMKAKEMKAELDEAEKIFQRFPALKAENYTYFLIRKASYYRIFDDYKTAFKMATEAERYAEIVKDKKNGATLNMMLGFGFLNEPAVILQHFEKAVKLYKQSNNVNGTAAMYNNISEFYIDRDDFKTAQKYTDSATALLPKVEVFYIIAKIYGTKSKILEQAGNYSGALENFKISTEWNSKANNELRELKVQEMDKIYNFQQNKNREIELAKDIKSANGWNATLTVFSAILAILMMMLLLFVAMLSRSKKRIEVHKQSISAKNQTLEKNIAEKHFLVRELNHRVKNNLAVILSLVGFQKDETEDVHYRYKFQQLQNRIKTIAMTHHLFSYNLDNFDSSMVEVQSYSGKILDSHRAGYTKEMNLLNHSEIIMIPVDKAMPFGLLLNELITNTLKHAVLPENKMLEIALTIQLENNKAKMEYADNGTVFGGKSSSNLGQFIIVEMVRQLAGTMERNNSRYQIEFPIT